MREISIVVPTLNEEHNISPLVHRIAKAFEGTDVSYEIIFVDDKSKDATAKQARTLAASFPIRLAMKKGPRGKAFSLLEGFKLAKYDVICMIDADLQYPPEAILPMHSMMIDNNVDLILTERVEQQTSPLRKLSTKTFNFIFAKMLFGFDYDTQSGLKLFKKAVIERATLSPTPWSFDLEFIVRALENNFKILSYQIPFSTRFSGETKVRVFKLAFELGKASLLLRANSSAGRVKQGYQMNLRLAKRISTVALLSLSIVGVAAYGPASSAGALPIVTPLIENTLNWLVPIGGQNPAPQTTPIPQIIPLTPQPTPPVSNTPTQSSPSSNSQSTTPMRSDSPLIASNNTPSSSGSNPVIDSLPASRDANDATYPSFLSVSKTNATKQDDVLGSSNTLPIVIATTVLLGAAALALIGLSPIKRFLMSRKG